MSYKDEIFTRYGSPCKEADIKFYSWLNRPDNCKTFEEIRHNDERAARLIAECKHMVSLMIEYRQDLAARYNQLATMPSKDSVMLQRHKSYNNSVNYYIRFFTEYEDGTKVETATETYAGAERHKALKRFEELQKQRPGIEYVKDIEKKQWER